MKTKLCFIAIILSLHISVRAQSGQWTWLKGDSTIASSGNYGIMGVPASTNEPPARYSPAFWTDTAGSFWMYGGTTIDTSGTTIDFWDMWKFDPVTLMWTWMNGDTVNIHDSLIPGAGFGRPYFDRYAVIAAQKGIFSVQNSPGSIGAGVPAWVTPNNHFWFHGGGIWDTINEQSNLWQYDPVINQWAWMGDFDYVDYGVKGIGDSLTSPGARLGSNSSWVDDVGNLWLFSCTSYDGGAFNDTWKYDVVSGIWTWMSGTKVYNDSGSYGIKGIPSTTNCPWARNTDFFWKDNAGNFWLAGGISGNGGRIRDIWKFNPQTLDWTWIGGANAPGAFNASPIGNICDSSYLNEAGGHFWNSTVWKVCDNLIINYGGASAVQVYPPL